MERRRIQITRSASKRNNTFDLVTPKTWELRSVAVPTSVMTLLVPVVEAARSPSALLWSRPGDGSPLRPPTTTNWFVKAVYRLAQPEKGEDGEYVRDEDDKLVSTTDFPVISAHQLRHTAASLMIRSGAHIKTVQRQLGHKSAAMTLDNYGHLYDDDLDEVASRMDAAITGQTENPSTNPVEIQFDDPRQLDQENEKCP
ncbi:tyrosine-type recombinase/integrase [Gordonia sp. ABSL1-1]|nr:tyrosine-type recombinase/integrase [Gordonia sp. ABSL1-1]MDL9936834.1 tyrosine-type recombinase/integrase [Gordonia sp. ABSL1-1]